jgi:hypothetical protein
MAQDNGQLVKFNADVFPYCKGDIRRLTKKELAQVDKAATARDLGKAYESYTVAAPKKDDDKDDDKK